MQTYHLATLVGCVKGILLCDLFSRQKLGKASSTSAAVFSRIFLQLLSQTLPAINNCKVIKARRGGEKERGQGPFFSRVESRVTRLGDFSPIGWLFEKYVQKQAIFLIFSLFMYYFWQKRIGQHFRRFFHKLIWSPGLEVLYLNLLVWQ
jgi:hypothetical protein